MAGAGFTYAGPSVSAAFVAGVFNDAWAKATERSAAAQTSRGLLVPSPVTVDAGALAPAVGSNGVYTVPVGGTLPGDTTTLKDTFEAQLEQMLADFVNAHYPTYEIPDAAAAWNLVANSFDGGQLEPVIAAAHSRVDDVWRARGYVMPAISGEYQHRYIERRAADARTNAAKNTEIIRAAHLAEMNLVKFELVMNTQLDALNAARTFLLGCIIPIRAKVDEDQLRLVQYQTQLQFAHWRYLDALIEADSMALERLILNRRITVDMALAGEARKEFVFRELAGTVIAETQSIVQQATAAIGQLHGRVAVGGGESL